MGNWMGRLRPTWLVWMGRLRPAWLVWMGRLRPAWLVWMGRLRPAWLVWMRPKQLMVVGSLQLSQHLRMNQVPSGFAVSVVSAIQGCLSKLRPWRRRPWRPKSYASRRKLSCVSVGVWLLSSCDAVGQQRTAFFLMDVVITGMHRPRGSGFCWGHSRGWRKGVRAPAA